MKKLVFGLIATIITLNLSYGQVNSISIKGIVSTNIKTKVAKQVSALGNDANTFYDKVNLTFKGNEQMQSFASEKELSEFLTQNPSKANGTLELFVNEEIVYSAKIVNGAKTNEEIFNVTTTSKEYPCTFPGIRQCAIDRIRSQNWFDMWTCVAEGFACVVSNYASCMIDNC